ncbi:MAG TPA: hypothetical protein VEC19_15100 [Usitatibacter sp.]|nr:hypothetical protein [Usitatibacter sp.]
MGIKDLFGGGKKKAEAREKAKEVAGTGKITPAKIEELKKVSEEHGVDFADDKTMMRKEIYNKAVGVAKGRGKLSDAEAAELSKIQKFLALRDDQVEKTKFDLTRLRTLTEIRQGNLPTVAPQNVALRGAQLNPGEVVHYAVQVTVYDRPNTGGRNGVQVKWAHPYVINSAKSDMLVVDGAKEVGEGYLLITSKRLYLRGSTKSAAVDYSPQSNLFLYYDGVRIERQVGHTLLKFKSGSGDTAEIIGELLAALMK